MIDTPEAPPASDEGATVQGTDGRAAHFNKPAVEALAKADVPSSDNVVTNGLSPLVGDEKKQAAIITKDSRGLEKALRELGYEYRYNSRAAQFQVSAHTDHGWQEITDRKDADLREIIANRFKFASKANRVRAWFGAVSWADAVNALAYRVEVDPFVDWLVSLPEWDETPRLYGWLRQLFNVEEPEDRESLARRLVSWASQAILLGAVARAFVPGFKIDEMIVLIGPQGCGKSTAIQWLLPAAERDEWFNDGLHLASDRKEQAEALQGIVYCEASEMAGTNRAELEALKAFLSRTNDRVRLVWRRNPESMPRRSIIVGTTNDHHPLPNDPTGNRRFVPVVVRPREGGAEGVRRYLDSNRLQLWAEAMWAWKRRDNIDVHPWLPAELKQTQENVNEVHRRSDELLENKLDDWLTIAPRDGFELSLAAVGCLLIDNKHMAANLSRRDALRLSSALRNAGYDKQHKRIDGRRAYVWNRID